MTKEDGYSNLRHRIYGFMDRIGYWISIYFYLFLLLITVYFSYHIIKTILGYLSCTDLYNNLESIYVLLKTAHFKDIIDRIHGFLFLSITGPFSLAIWNVILGRRKVKREKSTRKKKNIWRFFRGKSFVVLFLFLGLLIFGVQFKLYLDFLIRYGLLVVLHFSIFLICYLFTKILSKYTGLIHLCMEVFSKYNRLLERLKGRWKAHGEEFGKTILILFYLYLSSYFVLNEIIKSKELENIKIYIPNLILLILLIYIYKRFLNVFVDSIADHLIFEYLYSKSYVEKEEETYEHDFYKRNSKIVKDMLGLLFVLLIIVTFAGPRESLLELIRALISNYAMSFAIFIPILIYLAILLIDPYREGEVATFGEKSGKVVKLNPLFTVVVTLENEKVYIPNALLLARQFSRLSFRTKGEIGLLIRFSATLGYKYTYENANIEGRFKEIIENIKKDERKGEDSELRKYVKERVLKYTAKQAEKKEEALIENSEFKEDFLCLDLDPFVSVKEFKDHGIEYNFNVYIKKPFFLPLIRSFIMKKTFEKFEKEDIHIMTPLQIEYAPRAYNI